ncbi:reverse transcriptase domain-containing protein (plasmid) [Legionella sp. D16C41]|uniref:reverse transcriptase domain-containing protein n=1 Tax=Legionella sp. D16C41 TaxID=3402688 RepID=UPI003AF4ECB3
MRQTKIHRPIILSLTIEPIFEADFHDCSYGYRPKRNARQASQALRSDLYCQAWGVVEIDFKSYFTSIPHDKLLELISLRITDSSLLTLIKQTLKVGEMRKGSITPTEIGVPQGSPLSPLYSNIYLNVIDQKWHKMDYPQKFGATLHRYCDDIVLVCRKDALKAWNAFKEEALQLKLSINSEKTHITKLTKGFDFIGYTFVKRKSPKVKKNIIYIFPTKRSQQAIRHKIKRITSRRAPIKPEQFVKLINERVLGWVNYYTHTNASLSFRRLQHFINNRFRRYLTQRSKGRGFGWKQYPSDKLYSR